jgi:hypothetical protein
LLLVCTDSYEDVNIRMIFAPSLLVHDKSKFEKNTQWHHKTSTWTEQKHSSKHNTATATATTTTTKNTKKHNNTSAGFSHKWTLVPKFPTNTPKQSLLSLLLQTHKITNSATQQI